MKQLRYFVEVIADYDGTPAKAQAKILTNTINEILQERDLDVQPQLLIDFCREPVIEETEGEEKI